MKVIKTIGNNIIFILPSILFNNKKTINLFFLSVLPPFLYIKYKFPFILFVFYQFSMLVLVYFLSPLKLILNSSGIQYHIFWKIKWSNVKSYAIENGILVINTVDGIEKKVKNIDPEISKELDALLNQKINGAKNETLE